MGYPFFWHMTPRHWLIVLDVSKLFGGPETSGTDYIEMCVCVWCVLCVCVCVCVCPF